MPKKNKRRGRRDEKKNGKKRRREEAEVESASKKQKPADQADFITLAGRQDEDDGMQENIGGIQEIPFYGLLSESEQEYFKRADEMLELNQFNSTEGEHQCSKVYTMGLIIQ
jgi:nucleolar protein 9